MGHIVLIGPIGAGKSTVAPLVADLLGRQAIELDGLRPAVYTELGYDSAAADCALEQGGIDGLTRYWKPFELQLVEHAVALRPDAVLDFGAGHSHYDDPDHLRRVSAALAPHYVVLLLPSDDLAESGRILAARAPTEYRDAIVELNAAFLDSASNAALADHVLITGDRTPTAVAADVATAVTTR